MFEFQAINYRDRTAFYRELNQELKALMTTTWYSNLANASALIKAHLPDLNWAGFYVADGSILRLGPFQGLPACLEIPLGKGVCGTAAIERRSLIVDDVHAFPGHITCDAASKSEIVVPMIIGDRLFGVLDLDSPLKCRFSDEDRRGLEMMVQTIVTA